MPNLDRHWPSLLAALALGAAASSTGCDAVECADGTIEQNGSCVPANEVVDEASCGLGTVLGTDGTCVPEMPPTVCGPNTFEDTVSQPGVIVCVGTGGDGCSSELLCPAAAPNRVSVCGRLYAVENDEKIEGVDATGTDCSSPDAVSEGPCELAITLYDALEFAGNPGSATPIVPQDFLLDDCGRFRAHNFTPPATGVLGIGVDDTNGNPGTHRLTGVAFRVSAAQTINRQRLYVVQTGTDESWSTQASLSPGFVDRGVFMPVFTIGGDPAENVQITEGGAVIASEDFYFSDTDPFTRSTIDLGRNATGPNGAGLKISSSGVVEHSGTGGDLPGGCTWESALAATIPSVLFFGPRRALMGTTECQ